MNVASIESFKVVSRMEKHYKNARPFTIYHLPIAAVVALHGNIIIYSAIIDKIKAFSLSYINGHSKHMCKY